MFGKNPSETQFLALIPKWKHLASLRQFILGEIPIRKKKFIQIGAERFELHSQQKEMDRRAFS